MQRVAQRCNVPTTEDLLASLGFGDVTLQQALNRLREEMRLLAEQQQAPPSNEEVAAALLPSRDRGAGPFRRRRGDPWAGGLGLPPRWLLQSAAG